jgi:hypothetical protein
MLNLECYKNIVIEELKIKPRIHSWSPVIDLPSIPPINMIFETINSNVNTFTNTALLYQDILKYAIEHDDGFGFTELGNWLIDNNHEFRSYYVDSKARTPKNARLANRRQTIRQYIDNLCAMELLYIKSSRKAKKNLFKTPVYDLTIEGRFLAWIIEAKNPHKDFDLNWVLEDMYEDMNKVTNNSDVKRSKAIMKVFEIIDFYTSIKNSYILVFLSKFFRKCMDAGVFSEIIDSFYYADLRNVEVNRADELLRLFVGIDHPLNWIFQKEIFYETLNELDEQARKVILFQFKLEIEEYYNTYYLVPYIKRLNRFSKYNSTMTVSGKEWQVLRINNIANNNKIVDPGFCTACQSECPFISDILDFLNCLHSFSDIIPNCPYCSKKNSVVGPEMIAVDMVRRMRKYGWNKIKFK